MNITCPHCDLNGKISEDKVRASGGKIKCPRCKKTFAPETIVPVKGGQQPITEEVSPDVSDEGMRFLDDDEVSLEGEEVVVGEEVLGIHGEEPLGEEPLELAEILDDDIIEDEIVEPIENFSYPFAFPNQDKDFIILLKGMLKKCGYKFGVSTKIGLSSKTDEFFFLKRLPVNSFDDNLFLQAKLDGAYDWIYRFQLLYKSLKRRRWKP